ncbi:hypothetical protein [Metallibacterium scheffleri]|uniref:Uncharacterized protein n=1 Tax=Metallibacterium scheffleri TaxID=993689 RepID=A0A4S3KLN4_9GAMM|nr:hypothetical protein [Metallibacterium scheffleri]THD09308.1 hypothetical protein B1806_11290 [Metallibacterium scheffleri]
MKNDHEHEPLALDEPGVYHFAGQGELRHILTLTNGALDGTEFAWITSGSGKLQRDRDAAPDVAAALQEVGITLRPPDDPRRASGSDWCDFYLILRASGGALRVLESLAGRAGCTWVSLTRGSHGEARLEAVIAGPAFLAATAD